MPAPDERGPFDCIRCGAPLEDYEHQLCEPCEDDLSDDTDVWGDKPHDPNPLHNEGSLRWQMMQR